MEILLFLSTTLAGNTNKQVCTILLYLHSIKCVGHGYLAMWLPSYVAGYVANAPQTSLKQHLLLLSLTVLSFSQVDTDQPV